MVCVEFHLKYNMSFAGHFRYVLCSISANIQYHVCTARFIYTVVSYLFVFTFFFAALMLLLSIVRVSVGQFVVDFPAHGIFIRRTCVYAPTFVAVD